MSVSPHDSRRPEARQDAHCADDVFLAPRVVDQRAFDDLSTQLRALIQQAAETTATLTQQLQRAAETDAQSTRTMVQLQERLRLSARMLKAVQAQSSQIDAAVDRVRELHTMREVPAAVEQLLQERVEAMLQQAQARIDAHAESRRDELKTLEHQIELLTPQAEALSQLVESAEVNVAVLSHKAAQSAAHAEETTRRTHKAIEQCAASEQRLAELTDHSRDMVDLMNSTLRRGESVSAQRSPETGHVGGIDTELCERLENLLDRLKPWEPAVKGNVIMESTDRDQDALFARLRAELGAELGTMSQAIRTVVERMDSLAVKDQSAGKTNEAAGEVVSERVPEVVSERIEQAVQPSGSLHRRNGRA